MVIERLLRSLSPDTPEKKVAGKTSVREEYRFYFQHTPFQNVIPIPSGGGGLAPHFFEALLL